MRPSQRLRTVLASTLLLLATAPVQILSAPWSTRDVITWFGGNTNENWSAEEAGQRVLNTHTDNTHGDHDDNDDGRHDGRHDDTFRWDSGGFAALGDSYSAGIGTGFEGKEDECRLGLGAYPALVYGDLAAATRDKSHSDNVTSTPGFQWLSCTGSTTADVLGTPAGDSKTTSQIDALNTSESARLDFATLSVGGNDLGFFDVINACVFRFYGFYSGTCAAALEAAEALVADDDERSPFSQSLHVILLQILDRVRWEKRPHFRIFVTGYARFFDAETTTCNTCSLSVWGGPGNPNNTAHSNTTESTLLTQDLRRRMNGLVAGTNRKLQVVINRINQRFPLAAPRILFVDYDALFDGHRFCEPGVVEPAYDREATWFFLVGGNDNNHTVKEAPEAQQTTGKDETELQTTLAVASPLVNPDTCLETAQARRDWGELALCYMAKARQADPSLQPARAAGEEGGLLSPQNSMWYVPTYYGKTFHPRSNGHKAIYEALYQIWKENEL